MKAIPIHEAKANLSKYIQQAKAGKPIYIGARGEVEVMLTVAPKPQPSKQIWGSMRDDIWISDEAWQTASKQVTQDFDNSNLFPDAT